MIEKLYDFQKIAIPEGLLKAAVTREEIQNELALTAERFTTIAPASDGICNGDIVSLEIPDEQAPEGVRQVFVNMGRGYFDSEETLLTLCPGAQAEVLWEGKPVCARILQVKRKNVPTLTDERILQLGLEGISTIAEYESYVFHQKADQQRQRRLRGIYEIVSKAMLEHTQFAPVEESNEWYRVLYGRTMAQLEAMALQSGRTVDEILPEAMRMPGKSAQECRRAMREMCVKQIKLGLLGKAYADEKSVAFTREESIAQLRGYLPQMGLTDESQIDEGMIVSNIIQRYTEYFQQIISGYYLEKIQVELQSE